MKIATLLQNKHDSIQFCPFTATEKFNNIVDKNMSSPQSILATVVLCHTGFHRNILDYLKIPTY